MKVHHLLFLVLLAFISIVPNLGTFSLYMEESRRALVAYEMYSAGNLFQPTLLGEPYFNKPPLFNWLIIASSDLAGWGTLSPRLVSLSFMFMSFLVLLLLTLYLSKKLSLAVLSGLIYVTFSDILFWYGWLAEIDVTLSFFVFMLFVSMFFYSETSKPLFLYLASLFGALAFWLKGFPAIAFWVLTALGVLLHRRSLRFLLNSHFAVAFAVFLFFSFLPLMFSAEPLTYVKTLWKESFSRTESSFNTSELIKHILSYPLLNVKQLLPSSIFVLVLLLMGRADLKILLNNGPFRFFVMVTLLNYLPYIISAGSSGRYILPLFPIIALLFSYLLIDKLTGRLYKAFVGVILLSVALRFIYGAFFLPYLEEKRGYPQKVAYEVNSVTKGKRVACDCEEARVVCLYLGILRGSPVLKSSVTGGADYAIRCALKNSEEVLKEYRVDKRDLFLVRLR